MAASMTVFITGGSGFVGQYLIKNLIQKRFHVKALARKTEAVEKVKKLGAIAIEGDISQKAILEHAMRDCVSVFHLAASVNFYATADELMDLHVEATKLLLEIAKLAKVKNFIYLGAASVIINGQPIQNADESLLSNNLTDGYSITKLMAEKLVLKENSKQFLSVLH